MHQHVRLRSQLWLWIVALIFAQVAQAQVTLPSSGSYTEAFDGIGTSLPTGWTVRTGATATSIGTSTAYTSAATAWNNSAGAFKNFASGDIGASGTQASATDRALGLRQTGTFGDPGGAFVLQLDNTTGYQNFALSFKLQSLDAASPRTATWRVDYGFGATPTTFTEASAAGTLTTGGSQFTNNTVTANFGSALDNQSGPVWIRIVTIAGTTGSGNRPSTGIDDFSLTYAPVGTTPTVTLSANPTALSGFSTNQGMASTAKTYALSGNGLTANVTVTAPSGFEVSADGTNFQNSLTVAQSGGSVNTTISVRLTSSATGSPSGNVTNVSGSASANVAVSGTVASNSLYTSIATARVNVGQTFTIAGRVTVTNQLGSRQLYIQDQTGGIVVYSGSTGTDLSTLVQLGDSVQARGPISVFSGYTEITSPAATSFTVVSGAGTRLPTPVAITLDQLPSYQGQLVSVSNASITPMASTFTGGTNYTITANSQSATLRISANSPLAGAGQPANPVSVTGIADRFVSGSTAPGTDGLQLQPRILADIPGSTPAQDLTCTAGMSNSTLGLDQTLDIAAWNMEFFGADAGTIVCPNGNLNYNDMGPTNEDLQQSNAVKVLSKLNADIISVEEISDINRFAATVASLPGSYSYTCSNRFSYYFQNECDQTPSGNPPTVFGPTSLAQKVCVIYNRATVTPVLAETKPLLDGNYSYPSASNWSSGRLPFLFVGDVTINGNTQRVHVVAIHAKSGSATADYTRRKQDIVDLKANLDAAYPTAKLIILGDYNDKLNGSIASGQQSSYKPFVDDAANYNALTLPLENNGCSTFNSSASFIDHMIISNDLAPAYIANSTYVLQPFSIPNYGNTTSDHNPIITRFDLTKLAAPVTVLTLTASASPAQILTSGSTTLTASVSGGTTPYTYSFSGPGTIAPNGNSATVSGLPAGVQTFTVTVTDATTPTAQTSFTTVSVTVTMASTTPDNFAITGATLTNCQLVNPNFSKQYSFNLTPQYSGTTGAPISFSVANELGATTQPGPYALAIWGDKSSITLVARQGEGAVMTLDYNWKANCPATSSARLAAEELTSAPLSVKVLGNPAAGSSLRVEIRGTGGGPLTLDLLDATGRLLSNEQVERTTDVEQRELPLNPNWGNVLLLRASVAGQQKTLKVIQGR